MAEDEKRRGEDADEEGTERGEACGDDVVGWFVDGPDGPHQGVFYTKI